MKKIHSKGLFILLFVLLSYKGFSQLSTRHYIPPITDSDSGTNKIADQHMYISTPSDEDVFYEVYAANDLTIPFSSGVVSKAASVTVNLGTGYGQFVVRKQETSIVSKKGFIVNATSPVYVSIRFNSERTRGPGRRTPQQAGALVSKGKNALGKTFRVGAFTFARVRVSTLPVYLNFFSIMATEDNTSISFPGIAEPLNGNAGNNFWGDDSENILINAHNNDYIGKQLNKGESIIIALSQRNALIGQEITSDKDIVVNCGSILGSFISGGLDYGIDQIADTSKPTRPTTNEVEYIFVRGDGDDDHEKVLLVEHTPGTTYSINGGPSIDLNGFGGPRGTGIIQGDQYTNGYMHVVASAPIFAYQGVGRGGNDGNKGLFFVPPLNCSAIGNVESIANIDQIGSLDFSGSINIVTKNDATVSMTSSLFVGDIPLGTPTPVTGTDYVIYKVTDPLPNSTAPRNLIGDISIFSDRELYCSYSNYNSVATSGSFYSGFAAEPTISLNPTAALLGNCVNNVSINIPNAAIFDRFEWFVDTGSGFNQITVTDDTNPEYIPIEAGIYRVIGIIDCSTTRLSSRDFPISICPEDTDGDSVPNSIDIDLDNDGILNCDESNGNREIDLTAITTNIIPEGNGTPSISPSVNGNFTSTVPATNFGTETSVTYAMDFASPINLLLEYDISGSPLTVNQEFVIEVEDTKTLTLLNPDNQILVDTDFDGIFEPNVTLYHGFKIRFRINPLALPITNPTFTLSAYYVDQFTYKHINNSKTNDNQSSFKITEPCSPRDSDGDNVEDASDLDSDNDGIPDIIESLAPNNLTLSGVDANLDGLDDIFTRGTALVDSDNDLVFNFLDLDSDNDGIFDVEESGSGLPDTNFDGIIDDISTKIGANGWDDNAETTPDSGILNGDIRNTDTNTLFDYMVLDSDGDGCNDVTEAGFSDADNDGLLGDIAVTVDTNGLVNNATDGYNKDINNDSYIVATALTVTTQPEDTAVSEEYDTSISVETNSDIIQWQVSTDAGVTWNDITDDTTYDGSQSDTLNITAAPEDFDGYKYRAVLNITGNNCENAITDEILLTVTPTGVVVVTGFSPNNDGINDTYSIDNLKTQFPNFEIEIFNRWGRSVYKGNVNTPDWNGKKDNNGELVPVGVYFYVVNFNTDERSPEKGEIYVSR
ncbi:hypothetical protein A8C32_06605 [Flavivirga aquatica]|uniref:IgGFc-binding protein N-terminal domain-containing protein n=1 Tax=Flavivirga aquatica TaxID=1849968 RepID=A0A1E5SIB3_9FLAO|nr:gliding motility-associated C-terminal domain-containing protein [Flavivirga aquatica]OEJ98853.1 hypothetical protein A8C32_06605 [Flavivirga aquatica]